MLFDLGQQVIPIEGRPGIAFVLLHVIVPEDPGEPGPFLGAQRPREHVAIRAPRDLRPEPGKDVAQRGGQLRQCRVLLGRVVVLHVFGAADRAGDRRAVPWPQRLLGESVSAPDPRREDQAGSRSVGRVPLLERVVFAHRIGADVGDLHADAPVVALRGVAGTFLEVERLVDRAIDVEQEMHAQAADVVEDVETLGTRAADVVMQHELVDLLLEQRQRPAAPADLLELLGGERGVDGRTEPQVVAVGARLLGVGCGERQRAGPHLRQRALPVASLERDEAAAGPIRVVTALVAPEHDSGADPVRPAADDDFVAVPFLKPAVRRGKLPGARRVVAVGHPRTEGGDHEACNPRRWPMRLLHAAGCSMRN